MKDKDRDQQLRATCESLLILVGGTEAAKALRESTTKGLSFASIAVSKLEEYAEGWPPGGGDGRGGGDENGRTFTLAASHVDGLPSVATIRHFDALLVHAAVILREASDIATRAVVAIPSASAKVEDNPDDWCASCARLKDHKGRPYAEPSASVPSSPDLVRRTPEGTEPAKTGCALCQWCYGWTRGEGTWPPLVLIEKRRDGTRITSKVLTECGVHPKSDTEPIAS